MLFRRARCSGSAVVGSLYLLRDRWMQWHDAMASAGAVLLIPCRQDKERTALMFRSMWTASVHTRYFLRRYMPTNIALDAILTRRGLKGASRPCCWPSHTCMRRASYGF